MLKIRAVLKEKSQMKENLRFYMLLKCFMVKGKIYLVCLSVSISISILYYTKLSLISWLKGISH